MITIHAFDPGVTTGACLATYTQGVLFMAPWEARLSLAQMDAVLTKTLRMGGSGRTHVIYEDFEYRNVARRGLDLTPVKLIGVIELQKELWSTQVEFHKQKAAQGKAHFTDEKLKSLQLYSKGLKHGRDATRHVLHWVHFHSPIGLENPQCQLVELNWLLDGYYTGARFGG